MYKVRTEIIVTARAQNNHLIMMLANLCVYKMLPFAL